MVELIGNPLESIYARSPDPKVSDRYQFYPSTLVLDVMEKEGFEVTRMQGLSRRAKHPEYAKHLITFRKRGQMTIDNDGVPEFIFVNSHNRSSSAKWLHGYFRWACANGCIFGSFDQVSSITHTSNNPVADLLHLIQLGVVNTEKRIERIAQMKEIVLDHTEMEEYAEDAARLRGVTDSHELLYVNRREDMAPTLWHTYNRVQEALMRGKYDSFNPAKGTYRKARPINSINETLRINTELWDMTESWADSLTF